MGSSSHRRGPVRASRFGAMENVDVDTIRDQIAKQFEDAQALAEQATAARPAGDHADSEDGLVRVTVDGKGLLQQIRFDPRINEATAEQLRAATMEALSAAHQALRADQPDLTSARAALNDTTILDALSSWLPEGQGK